MTTLYELQKQFVDGLEKNSDAILQYIAQKPLSPAYAFSIYQNSTKGVLQKTLQAIYPVSERLVGRDFFITLINHYIEKNLSYSSNLDEYGATLPAWIAEYTPAASLPYLSDVAKLEWAWHEVFNAPTTPPLDFAALSACSAENPESIIFLLPPKSILLASTYPIHRIFEANQPANSADEKIQIENDETYFFLIWRDHLERRIDLLTADEYRLLVWIQKEYSMGQIANEIEKTFSGMQLDQLLPRCVKSRWLVDFKK